MEKKFNRGEKVFPKTRWFLTFGGKYRNRATPSPAFLLHYFHNIRAHCVLFLFCQRLSKNDVLSTHWTSFQLVKSINFSSNRKKCKSKIRGMLIPNYAPCAKVSMLLRAKKKGHCKFFSQHLLWMQMYLPFPYTAACEIK